MCILKKNSSWLNEVEIVVVVIDNGDQGQPDIDGITIRSSGRSNILASYT